MSDDTTEPGAVMWKVVGVVAALGAARVADRLLDKGWAKFKGGEPPRNSADPQTNWSEALLWAVASGAVIGLAKMFGARGAAQLWVRRYGQLPPGIDEVGA